MSFVQVTDPANNTSVDSQHETAFYNVQPNAAGNTLLLVVTWDTSSGASISSITDTGGNSWSQVDTQIDATNTQRGAVWAAFNCSATTNNVVTVVWSVGAGSHGLMCAEMTASAGVDVHASQLQTTNTGATDNVTSTAATTTQSGEDVLGFFIHTDGANQLWTAGTGYTLRKQTATTAFVMIETQTQSTAGSIAATGTVSSSSARNLAFMVALSPSGGAAVNVGYASTSWHPGRGPNRRARVYQTPRSTDAVSTVQNATATIVGAGVLTDVASIQQAPATPTGAGAITANSAQQAAAGLSGAGTMSAFVTEIAPATLAGAGVLTAAAAGNQSGSCSLAGAGSLSVAATVLAPATMTGAGALTPPAVRQLAPAAPTGTGILTPPHVRQLAAVSAVGVGALSASAGGTVLGTATVVGAGVLTAIGSVTSKVFGTASIRGEGFLAASGSPCITARPELGITTYDVATTIRSNTGSTTYSTATTARPNTGETDPPCG